MPLDLNLRVADADWFMTFIGKEVADLQQFKTQHVGDVYWPVGLMWGKNREIGSKTKAKVLTAGDTAVSPVG